MKYICNFAKSESSTYCTTVHGSVFDREFRVLAREFEFFETFPGFVQRV
jgi:hypothetical protein